MTRRRVWVALGGLVVVLLVAAGIGWAGWGGDLGYRHTLVKYDDNHGEPNRYVNLDDSDAQLSIGSPDGHRIVVQWRDPDGHGWTEPETVWNDKSNLAFENTVRFGGGTVAIQQLYTSDVHSDSDVDSFSIGIVCRERSCTARKVPGSESQVTPDGRTAYLGEDPKGAVLWTSGEGIHRVAVVRTSGIRVRRGVAVQVPCWPRTGPCAWSPRSPPVAAAPSTCSPAPRAPRT